MIRAYLRDTDRLRVSNDPSAELPKAVWIDLVNPSAEETAAVAESFGIEIPSREDMEEIEASSRLSH